MSEKKDKGPSLKHKLAAAKAAAHLPKGYIGATGHNAQNAYLAAIQSYDEHADAAANMLYDCAVANLTDGNRRQGFQSVIEDLKRQMEFFTGADISGRNHRNIEVVSIEPKVEKAVEPEPEINVV